MLNYAIAFTFKLIILIMLLYILSYIVDLVYFAVYIYPKLLKDEPEKNKLIEDDNIDKAVDDIFKKIKELDKDDE